VYAVEVRRKGEAVSQTGQNALEKLARTFLFVVALLFAVLFSSIYEAAVPSTSATSATPIENPALQVLWGAVLVIFLGITIRNYLWRPIQTFCQASTWQRNENILILAMLAVSVSPYALLLGILAAPVLVVDGSPWMFLICLPMFGVWHWLEGKEERHIDQAFALAGLVPGKPQD